MDDSRHKWIAAAILAGVPIAWGGVLVLWWIFGDAAFYSLLIGLGCVFGLWGASKHAKKTEATRLAAEGQALWEATLAQYHPSLHLALWIAHEPTQWQLLWTLPQIMIGRAETPVALGLWPTLLPGQDPGQAPDDGLRPSPVGMRMRISLPHGFARRDVEAVLDRLASTLQVPAVKIVAADQHWVQLELRVRNPLAATVRLPKPEPSPVPLESLRVGLREDGLDFRLQLLYNHLFLAGVTGSGKSGVLWSIIAALAPDIAAGRVELHVIDLKYGAEMGAGARLFTSFAHTIDMAFDTMENLVLKMETRGHRARVDAMRTGVPSRKHVPVVGDPYAVLMIDEILDLMKVAGDQKITRSLLGFNGEFGEKAETIKVKDYAGRLLLLLLSKSRAFAFSVLVATQNAAKEIFELLRDMFPTMIGLRQSSAEQQRMVFQVGATERGVEATAITTDEAGTAFIDSPEKGGQAIRTRFYKVEDEDITWLVNTFGRSALALPAAPASKVLIDPPTVPMRTAASASAGSLDLPPVDDEDTARVLPFESPARTVAAGPEPTLCENEACTEGENGTRALVEQTPGRKTKMYCSPACRVAAHRARKRTS